jgi:hypothetical protein
MKKLGIVTTLLLMILVLQAPRIALGLESPVLSTEELVEHSLTWDGETVAFEGEVLQDVMVRESGTWLNISDGNNTAMGVFIPVGTAVPAIEHTETYRTGGDVVRVTGVFHRACSQHQGETDIHVASLTVLVPGSDRSNPIHPLRFAWLAGLALLLALAVRVYYRKRPPTS